MTTYINLFGGPGIGKSTAAAGLYWYMKTKGHTVELINEYAKDRVWLNDLTTLQNQTYVSAKQYQRMLMVKDQTDWAITDSPLLVGLVYGQRPVSFEPYLLHLHHTFDNINILLSRCVPFEAKGRVQNEQQSKEKDIEIRNVLENLSVSYTMFENEDWSLPAIEALYDLVLSFRTNNSG